MTQPGQLEQSCDDLVSECMGKTLRGKWMTERELVITEGWERLEPKGRRELFGTMLATRLRALAAIDDAGTLQEVVLATDYEEIKRAVQKGALDKDSQAFLSDFTIDEEWNYHKLRRIHIVRIMAYLKILESMPELRKPVPSDLEEIYYRSHPPNANDKWAAFWHDLAPQIEEEISDNIMEVLPKIGEFFRENLQQKANYALDDPGPIEIKFDKWYSDPEFKRDFFETFNRVLRLILRRARRLPKGIASLNGRPFDFGRRPIAICRQALDNFAINQIIGSFIRAEGKAVHLTEYAKERGLKAIVSEKGLTVIDTKSNTTIELGKEPKPQKTTRYMPYLHLQLHRWVQAAKEHSADSAVDAKA